jgi:hypothetical protein
LLATQLVARLRNKEHIEFPLMYIFEYPSIALLSVAIQAFKSATVQTPDSFNDDDLEDISI